MKLFGKLEKLTRIILQRNASPATIESNTTEVYADNTSGKPKIVVDVAGSETTYHLPVSEGATNVAGAYTTTLTVTNNTSVTLPITGTLSTLAGAEELSSKKLTGGAASTSNQWTIPNKSDITGLTDNVAGNIVYDTTAKKLKVSDGSGTDAGWKIVGGGLIPVELTSASFTANSYTAASGYHYLVDMAGAGADQTIVLPAGAAEQVVKISVVNNLTGGWKLIVDGNSSETIFYNDAANTAVNFVYEEQWAELSYDVGLGSWVVNDGSSPISGTFTGNLSMTGKLSVDHIGEATSAHGIVHDNTCEFLASTSASAIKAGSLEIQAYAKNNTWIGDNVYYSGGWKYRADGYTARLRFNEDGFIFYGSSASGSAGAALTEISRLDMNRTATTFNDAGLDIDFKIKSDTLDAFFVDGGTGNVGIGTATPTASTKLSVKGGGNTSATFGVEHRNSDNTACFLTYDNGAGYLLAAAWTYGSDAILKENVQDLGGNCLSIMDALHPKKFDYIKGSKNEVGFIAQDVQKVLPDLVSVTDKATGLLGLKTTNLIPYLVGAIKELHSVVEGQQALIAALTERLSSLQDEVTSLKTVAVE